MKKTREVLFRGRAINRIEGREYRTNYKNGDWVYGLISKPYREDFPSLPAEMTNTYGVSGIDVDYTTIGQYTGLTDKNGVKIFEGDIIQTKHGRLCEVVWRSNSAVNCWDIYPLECKHRSPDEWDLWGSKNLLVVGNIHNNPELLKGEV